MTRSTTISTLPVMLVLASGAAAQTDRALERELLADAAIRTSLQDGATAGHDGKFYMASGDGRFRLNIRGQSQFRYNLNSRDATAPDEDLTNGFNARRTKLEFSGHIHDNWNYKIVGAFSRSDGYFDLQDAVFSYKFEIGADFRWGQFKLPFMREENTSSKYQLAADRSAMNEVFNQSRSQGIQLTFDPSDNVKLRGAISDGFGTANTSYFSTAENDVALTARADIKFGDASWKTFSDFTSFREGETGGSVGAAIHWETMGETANTTTFGGTAPTDMDMFTYTADASYEGGGWNVFGSFVGRSIDPAAGASFDDFGASVQGGVFLSEKTELFGRWDAIFPDDSRTSGDDFHTLTVGANHYFVTGSHAAKLTADVQWFFDNQAASSSVLSSNEGIGLAPDAEDDQISLRIQMQLLF